MPRLKAFATSTLPLLARGQMGIDLDRRDVPAHEVV
jgi:hypothetical protein